MLQPKDTHWLSEYKNKTRICAIYKKPTSDPGQYRLKVRGWKNTFHSNGRQKKARAAILISDKVDLKINKITRDKEGHCIMIQGSIQEEDVTVVNIYAHNIEALHYIRQTDIKGETDRNTIIVRDFNTLLTPMDRSSKQKIRKCKS